MGRMTAWHLAGALLVGGAALGSPASAQTPDTLVTPGPGYAAGGFHRWLFGSHYRDLWTTPVRVPVLDLRSVRRRTPADGARRRQADASRCDSRAPTAAGTSSARSTRILRRCCPSSSGGRWRSASSRIRSAPAHPGAPLVVSPILDAAGVLHSEPRLVFLPDDPALGEFRADFGGLLGTIEERPTDAGPASPAPARS